MQHNKLAEIVPAAKAKITAVQASPGLRLSELTSRSVTIHFSDLPWVRFTGLPHARSFRYPDSCPRISVGRTFAEGAVRGGWCRSRYITAYPMATMQGIF